MPLASELAVRRCPGSGEPITARPVGRVERTAKWVKRNKGLSAGLVAAVVALLLGTGVSAWQAIKANKAAENEAVQRIAAVKGKKAAEAAKTKETKARQQAETDRTCLRVRRTPMPRRR